MGSNVTNEDNEEVISSIDSPIMPVKGESNGGLILEDKPKDTDYIFGASPVKKEIRRPDGQWDDCLPVKELQRKRIETNACVSFSADNNLEIIHKYLYHHEPNYSDRFTAKMSGTNPNSGNSMSRVADSIRHSGMVSEEQWPYPDNLQSKYDYYSTVTANIVEQGKEWLKQYEVNYEWIYNWTRFSQAQKTAKLIEALQYNPIQVSVNLGAGKDADGFYRTTNNRANHAVTLYGYVLGEYWKIFDHYEGVYKKLAWNFNFNHAMQYTITKKPPLYEVQKEGRVDGRRFPKGSFVNKAQAFRFIATSKDYVLYLFKRLGSLIKK